MNEQTTSLNRFSVSSRSEFWAGVKAELPILVGVIPFGMIYGALALSAGLPAVPAQAMSSIIFAGSAQFVASGLFGNQVPGLIIILTIAVVNLRHMLYSASMAPYTRHLRPVWKWILAYLLTDEAYAATINHYTQDDTIPLEIKHWFFFGAGLALWTCWQISTAIGIFLGTQIPSSWSLDFTISLTFIALVMPLLRDRASIATAITSGIAALFFTHLPLKLGLIAAAVVGITVGIWIEEHKK